MCRRFLERLLVSLNFYIDTEIDNEPRRKYNMTPKEELKIYIATLERNIENPILQCDPRTAMTSRNATKSNYEAFIKGEINKEELIDNNNKIGAVTRKFMEMCSCMRESKR